MDRHRFKGVTVLSSAADLTHAIFLKRNSDLFDVNQPWSSFRTSDVIVSNAQKLYKASLVLTERRLEC